MDSAVQVAQPNQSQHSRPQTLRSAAHLRLAGRLDLAAERQPQNIAKQRETVAQRRLLQSAPAVLQDMAAHAAEAVAVCYLAEARSGMRGDSCTAGSKPNQRRWWEAPTVGSCIDLPLQGAGNHGVCLLSIT